MRERTVLYVHDLFLLTRKQDLNWAARFYMAHSFRWAITRLRYFLANSETTKRQLAQKVSKDARIELYRPRVDNVFQLRVGSKEQKANGTLIVGALGTIEPRKNFLASARICEALSNVMRRPVELHIIGRAGWGSDFQQLSTTPNVRLHGPLADGAARRVIADEVPIRSRVYPSGRVFMTTSVPTLLPAPGLFSMTNCWPRRSDSHWPIRRAMMSVDPPAANGTTMRTGRAG